VGARVSEVCGWGPSKRGGGSGRAGGDGGTNAAKGTLSETGQGSRREKG